MLKYDLSLDLITGLQPRRLNGILIGLRSTGSYMQSTKSLKSGSKKPASKQQVGGNHYKSFVIQPAEFIHKNKLGFLEGNVIKYVCRHGAKHGKLDLEKARHYLDLLLEWEYGTKNNTNRSRVSVRRRNP